jgi:NADH-quinone oxidoreductase subunit F
MAETTIGFEPPAVVLADAIEAPLTDLTSYRAVGGYAQLERARAMTPHDVTDQLIQSNLRGRGGAFFPTGRKASFIPTPDKVAKPIYLTVNADESEPGTFKDREIMLRVPHRLIEGCLIAAHAISSKHVFIYIRGEYSTEYDVLAAALAETRAAGLLGEVELTIHRGAGAYICGEETALLESLEGKPGKPRFKPPFPANFGVYGAPTTINNTLSYASVPTILRRGPAWFAGLGPANSGGTMIYSMSGHVARPRNIELPLGVPFADLLEMNGGMKGGRKIKAVIPGGVSVPVVPGDIMMKTNMDYDSVKAAGSALGTGAAIVMDETTCMVRALERISRFYYAESCGQCTPCREGTGWMNRLLRGFIAGEGRREQLALLLDVANRIEGHTICAFGDAAAWPVQGLIRHFRHVIEERIDAQATKPLAPSVPVAAE